MLFLIENSSLGGMKFGKDGDGNYGYYGADGSLIPFKSGDFILNKGEMYLKGKIVQITTGSTNTVQLGYSSYQEGWTIFVPDDDMLSFTVGSNNRGYRGIIVYKDGTFSYAVQSSQFASATIPINHSKEPLFCLVVPMSPTGTVSNGGFVTFTY